MAVSRSGIDNTKVQEMINAKVNAGVTDASGNKLSKIAIQAEIARALKAQFIAAGKKPDDAEIDFLVYGKDNT
jgi:hypothetical protein